MGFLATYRDSGVACDARNARVALNISGMGHKSRIAKEKCLKRHSHDGPCRPYRPWILSRQRIQVVRAVLRRRCHPEYPEILAVQEDPLRRVIPFRPCTCISCWLCSLCRPAESGSVREKHQHTNQATIVWQRRAVDTNDDGAWNGVV